MLSSSAHRISIYAEHAMYGWFTCFPSCSSTIYLETKRENVTGLSPQCPQGLVLHLNPLVIDHTRGEVGLGVPFPQVEYEVVQWRVSNNKRSMFISPLLTRYAPYCILAQVEVMIKFISSPNNSQST